MGMSPLTRPDGSSLREICPQKAAVSVYTGGMLLQAVLEGFKAPSRIIATDWGVFLFLERRYQEAEPIALQASAILDATSGPEYPDVAANLQVLGYIRRAQGRKREAEPLLKRSLAIRNAAMGLVTSGK